MITKARLILYSKYFVGLCLIWLTACQATEQSSEVQSPPTATSSEVIADSLLLLRAAEGLIYYQDQPFSGTGVKHYPSGGRAQTITYLQGKRQGVYHKWFPDGQLSYKSHYTNGKQDGLTRSWWNNGHLRSESQFVAGVAQGLQQQWYASGAKFKHIRLVDGREEGLQQSWRENGKIYNNYEAKNGRIFGLKRASLCFQLENEEVQYKAE